MYYIIKALLQYYTMLCFTRVLDFSRVFTRIFDTMLVSKTQVKTREKREKVTQCKKKRKKILQYLHYARFCSQTWPKRNPNA